MVLADDIVPQCGPCNNELAAVATFLTCMSLHAYTARAHRVSDSGESDIQATLFMLHMSDSPESDTYKAQRGALGEGSIAQSSHRRTHLTLLLATEQHHQIVAGTQQRITTRHNLAFAATQADDQTPRRPTHVTHPLAVRNRPHFQWQFHNAAAHMACDRHLHALRAHVPLQQLPHRSVWCAANRTPTAR